MGSGTGEPGGDPGAGLTPPGPPPGPAHHPPPPPSPGAAGAPGPGAPAYGAPEAYHDPGAVPDRGLALTGLGLGLAFCVPCAPIAAVVVSIIALARGRFRPRWLAVLGLVAGLGFSGLQIALVPSVIDGIQEGIEESLDDQAEDDADEARRSNEPRKISVMKLDTGDCIDSAALKGIEGTEEIRADFVTLVPCRRKHDLEVFATLRLAGTEFPGRSDINRRMQDCLPKFRKFVGASYGDSPYEMYFTFPLKSSWDLLGDHEITCLIGHPDHKVRGSLERHRR